LRYKRSAFALLSVYSLTLCALPIIPSGSQRATFADL
jgi:hypothetical protein